MASKRRVRRKQCGDKKKHPNWEGAVIAIKRHGLHGVGAYKCGFCGSWHVGHAPKKVRQAMRAKLER